jgi:hypothetical protein
MNNIKQELNKLYALWYIFKDSEKTTNVISSRISDLWDIHSNVVNDKQNYIHKYIHNIKQISVYPIMCYIYKKDTKELIRIEDITKIKLDNKECEFYATQCYPPLTEVLVYLSKEDHDRWYNISHGISNNMDKNQNDNIPIQDNFYPDFFYNQLVSLNPINLNTYYEEGIMNA